MRLGNLVLPDKVAKFAAEVGELKMANDRLQREVSGLNLLVWVLVESMGGRITLDASAIARAPSNLTVAQEWDRDGLSVTLSAGSAADRRRYDTPESEDIDLAKADRYESWGEDC